MTDISGQELLDRWWQAHKDGRTERQHAEELGLRFDVYHGRLWRAKLQAEKKMSLPPTFEGYDRPSLFDWKLPETFKFTWDDFMVVGDVQLPTTDYDFAMLPALVARRWLKTPRRLIIAGDFWNMDAFSQYGTVIKLPDYKTHEKQAAANLLTIWGEVFDEMYMICGNHERRRLLHMEGEEDIQDIVNTVVPYGRIRASVLDRCEVTTSRGVVNVIHGAAYRKNALTMADELAQKFQSHIISHHEHHCAFGVDRYDRYYIINNGGLFDVNKMTYVNIVTAPCSGMSQGFTMVKDATPYLFNKFSDWTKWL